MRPGMWDKAQHYKITSIITTKPRIIDAGLYSLSNRLGKGLHSCLAPQHGLEPRTQWLTGIASEFPTFLNIL
jgi:hypothetical protein